MLKRLIIGCVLIVGSLSAREPVIVGIAGGTGCGKTTLAKEILKVFPNQAVVINQDSYYRDLSHLSLKERDEVNFDHPNSLDFNLLKEHIIALKAGQAIQKPIYNFQSHTREVISEKISSTDLIVVEGILLFAVPEVRELFDVKVFIDADADLRVLRRAHRDISERGRDLMSVTTQYLKTVKPMHATFVEPSKEYADVIIPRGGENRASLGVIIAKLREDLNN